jgi:hypothetical protein
MTMPYQTFELSVVIGIRNWGLERLELALRAMRESTLADGVDIIISDCGSDNRAEVAALAAKHAAQYVYCDASVWSRSLALNSGIARARSERLLVSDADFVFSPKTLEIIAGRLAADPQAVIIFQASDLPERFGAEALAERFDWPGMAAAATMRPCWGMGCASFTRETFELIRGYEERMVVWGAEDNDFVKRAMAAGRPVVWMDHPEARLFHIWHLPFLQSHPDANAIFDANRRILNEDVSIVRNLDKEFVARGSVPTVSVVVATRDRAHLIGAMIDSVLGQTLRDLELIIVDDASTDDTRSAVRRYRDDRIRYLRLKEQGGVGRARNIGNQLARGAYIAVHDDDDIMISTRLEHQLAALRAGDAGSYGGWIDFNEPTGAVEINRGKTPFSMETMLYNGKVLLHPTLLLRRDVYLKYRYSEHFAGGSDYNFMMRMARDGLSLRHCGQFVILRRFHDSNLTLTTHDTQKIASKLTTSVLLAGMTEAEEKAGRLVSRNAVAHASMANIGQVAAEEILRLMPASLVHHWLELPFEQLGARVDSSQTLGPVLIDYVAQNGTLAFTKAGLQFGLPAPLLEAISSIAQHRAVPRRGTSLSNPSLGSLSAQDEIEDLALHRLAAGSVVVADFCCPENEVAMRLGAIVMEGESGTLIRRGNDIWSLITASAANDHAIAARLIDLGGTVRRVSTYPADHR